MTPREEAPVTVTPEDVALFSELSDGRKNASTKLEAIARHRTQSAAAAKAREEGMREALTPSGDTKAAYMGEFAFNITLLDEDGEEYSHKVYVPWTTIKEIMAAIAARAALSASDGEAPHA